MNKDSAFDICAGWLPHNPKIGICHISRARAREIVAFEYDQKWLKAHPDLILDPELLQMPGVQYPSDGKPMFGFLSDICPDRWGRKLMDRREVIDARAENRPIRKLMGSDYMLGVHDGGRQGGIRIMDKNGNFVSDRKELAAPPLTELRKLQDASLAMEENAADEDKWLNQLIDLGSSLGGARPKANVLHTDGNIWIAKFPSKKDEIDVGAWEMVAHDLAQMCGITVPDAELHRFSDRGGTFVVKRFDRMLKDQRINRIHFASAMTMLQETDGSDNTKSYLDILSAIEEYCGGNVTTDAQELWKRMVFNICIGNTDDHLRNHGLILVGGNWRLSPAYDINPVPDRDYHSLCINDNDNTRDIRLAKEVGTIFRVPEKDIERKAEKIQKTVSDNWRRLASRYGIPQKQQEYVRHAFSEAEKVNQPEKTIFFPTERKERDGPAR